MVERHTTAEAATFCDDKISNCRQPGHATFSITHSVAPPIRATDFEMAADASFAGRPHASLLHCARFPAPRGPVDASRVASNTAAFRHVNDALPDVY